jgi:hypothetical protein
MVSPEKVADLGAVLEAAAHIQTEFRSRHMPFCSIGGLAVNRWGEPRATVDVNLTIACEVGGEHTTLNRVETVVAPRHHGSREFALERRVYLGQLAGGVGIDISFGILDFELRMVARATPFDFGKSNLLVTCSAEDLIVLKAFAGRDQDWLDIAKVVHRQHARLVWSQIDTELMPLIDLKGEPEIADQLYAVRRKAEREARRPFP